MIFLVGLPATTLPPARLRADLFHKKAHSVVPNAR